MDFREVSRVEIVELLRRRQSGPSQRELGRATSLSRTTVRKFILAAESYGLR